MTTTPNTRQAAERGDIFGTPDGQIVRVTRASQSGKWADIQVVGGPLDGHTKRMLTGIPAAWSRYPRR